MNTFNREAAEAARYNDPSLTIFETGEMLEPHLALEAPKPNGPLTGAPGPKANGTIVRVIGAGDDRRRHQASKSRIPAAPDR
jgi:hypothetical protein